MPPLPLALQRTHSSRVRPQGAKTRTYFDETLDRRPINREIHFAPGDPEDPQNWAPARKWTITAISLLATFLAIANGTIITVASEPISVAFGVANLPTFSNFYWTVTSWSFGGGLIALVGLPLMEDFGLRIIFLVTYFLFMLSLVPQALAKNFATILITRTFSGGFVAILANSAASLIANVWPDETERTIPLSMWMAIYLAGVSLGPTIGAVIIKYLSWRWLSWVQLIYLGIFSPIYIFGLAETRMSAIIARRARKSRQQESVQVHAVRELDKPPLLQVLRTSIGRPLYMLMTEPVLFVFTLWAAFVIGTTYLFTQSVEQVFAELYGWDSVKCGFVQAATVVGVVLGWPLGFITKKWYTNSGARNTESSGEPIPEARLYMSIFGGLLAVPGGMFVYAWTSYPFLPWTTPAIGLAMVGFGNVIIVSAIADYLIDSYSQYAGSAMAAVAVGENLFAGALPLATAALYTNLGFQFASLLLGLISLVLGSTPLLLIRVGRTLRRKSPYMNTADEQHGK